MLVASEAPTVSHRMRFSNPVLCVLLWSSLACAQGEGGSSTAAPLQGGAKACTSAKDCHGMLPRFCRTCADGATECAHFACEEGACRTVTCDAHPAGEGEACGPARACAKGLSCHAAASDGGVKGASATCTK